MPLMAAVYILCPENAGPITDNRYRMPNPATIQDVLNELDTIIDRTIEENSPLGIFAYVYRRTTAAIAEGIREGRFEDSPRMERFDVDFADRYIEAYRRHRQNEPVSGSWLVAFEAADNRNVTILQHLLLGMNAHINLDLGIAAAGTATAPDKTIESLKHDFVTVNEILAELVDEIQQRIARVSPLMFLLDWVGDEHDEAVVNFSIRKARNFAWRFAEDLSDARNEEERDLLIRKADRHITELGGIVAHPPGVLLSGALSVIRWFEVKDTRTVIERLKA